MHDTALAMGRCLFEIYGQATSTIIELGACNVNGTLRDVSPAGARYIGLDVASGPGVDVVIKPICALPFISDSADIVVSTSMFEHDNFFWQTFLEMARITKPGGIIYVNAPSNGWYHRYPIDNWRFYPDCGKALVSWAATGGHELTLVELFIAERMRDVWNDFVAIFRKASPFNAQSIRFISDSVRCTNVWRLGDLNVRFEREASEDLLLTQRLQNEVNHLREELVAARSSIEQLQANASVEPDAAGRQKR